MTRHERFFPPTKAPKPAYAGDVAIRRLINAARKAGLDPAGVEALPDGTVRLLDARLAPKQSADLFEELERAGKI